MLCRVSGKDIMVSVIYNFVKDELYWAVKGGGAWLNNNQIHVSDRSLERSFVEISTDFKTEDGRKLFMSATESVKTVTRFNCSCFTSCMIASGRIEGRIVTYGKGGPWDYAPGALLISEAGGVVEHFGGEHYDYTKTNTFVAGTKTIVEFARRLTQDA